MHDGLVVGAVVEDLGIVLMLLDVVLERQLLLFLVGVFINNIFLLRDYRSVCLLNGRSGCFILLPTFSRFYIRQS